MSEELSRAVVQFRPLNIVFSTNQEHGPKEQLWPLSILTPPNRWNYGSLSSELDFSDCRMPRRVCVQLKVLVHQGPVGIGLVSAADIGCLLEETILTASDEPQTVVFVRPEQASRVCVRTADVDIPGIVEIQGIYVCDDAAFWKERKAAQFSHWYYTCNLGDGLIRRATVSDEPSWTRANAVSRSIFRYLLARHVGDVASLRVLDVACSAGHFSFLFASLGASVHGFDHDAAAIAQARFIDECTGNMRPGTACFSVCDLTKFHSFEPLSFSVLDFSTISRTH